jgi:membrane-bound serine protease (ClpP class)
MRMSRRILWTVVQCAMLAWPVSAAEVVRVRVEDTIQPASQQFIERAIEEAEARDAALVVLELDTPGGLLDSTREITTAITGSEVPVAVFVTPGGRPGNLGRLLHPGLRRHRGHVPGDQHRRRVAGVGSGRGRRRNHEGQGLLRRLGHDPLAREARGRNVDLAVEAVVDARSFTAEEALEAELSDLVANNVEGLMDALDGREITRFDGRHRGDRAR